MGCGIWISRMFISKIFISLHLLLYKLEVYEMIRTLLNLCAVHFILPHIMTPWASIQSMLATEMCLILSLHGWNWELRPMNACYPQAAFTGHKKPKVAYWLGNVFFLIKDFSWISRFLEVPFTVEISGYVFQEGNSLRFKSDTGLWRIRFQTRSWKYYVTRD